MMIMIMMVVIEFKHHDEMQVVILSVCDTIIEQKSFYVLLHESSRFYS